MATGTTPRLARAVWVHVSVAPRKYDSTIDWAKRMGWTAAEAIDAVKWLEQQKLVESYERTAEEWLRVAPGASIPEGEERPAPSPGGKAPKAAPKAPLPPADEDEGEDEHEEGGDDQDEDGESEESDEAEEPSPEPPPAARKTKIDQPPRRRAKAEKPARRARAAEAEQLCGKAPPISNPPIAPCSWPAGHDGPHHSTTGDRSSTWDDASSGQRCVSEDDPILETVPAPHVVLRAIARLPADERERTLAVALKITKLAANVERARGALAEAEAAFEAALRGETPEAPKASEPAKSEPAPRAPKARPKPAGRAKAAGRATLEQRIRAELAGGQSLSPTELQRRLGESRSSVSVRLMRMLQEGKLERPSAGVYRLAQGKKRGAA